MHLKKTIVIKCHKCLYQIFHFYYTLREDKKLSLKITTVIRNAINAYIKSTTSILSLREGKKLALKKNNCY